MQAAKANVGFVGLGNIGGPMSRRIVDAGWPLTIYARRPEALEPFKDTPAVVVPSLRELGERSEIVGICVLDDASVEEVMLGDNILAGMKPGGVIMIHSTINPDTCRKLAEVASKRGVAVIDAPISGGADGAAAGTLGVMVGGDPAAFERSRPVIESFARIVRLIGPLGSGQITKLMNNTLYAAQCKLIDETVSIGEQLGLDRSALIDMLQSGTADSFVLKRYAVTKSFGYWTMERGGSSKMRSATVIAKDQKLFLEVIHGAKIDGENLESVSQEFVDALQARLKAELAAEQR